ncbi:hypothetical protein R1sor_018299 [Riccia sorocarpa]|uniref:Uncharacterized protein n=1 Tax=Riccia sorocarpa TaxID=122646 RepID=A0ABD3I9E6_9MARC
MSFIAGSLDACAAQMASWQPFSDGKAAATTLEQNGCLGAGSGVFTGPDLGVHSSSMSRCNSVVSMLSQGKTDNVSLNGVHLSGRSISCPSLNVNSGEVACANSTSDGLVLQPCKVVAIAVCAGAPFNTATCPPARSSPWEESSSASLAKCHSLPAVRESRFDVYSNTTSICTFASAGQGMMHEGRKRVGRWSKRKKQLSGAFLRSLWRWKEGVHARKRRKRAVVASFSGSGARSYTSDPPLIAAASVGNPKSVIGTDSSGELFFRVVDGRGSWGADFLASTTSSESAFCCGDIELRNAVADHSLSCWFNAHNDGSLTSESGYNSEPGYSADSEPNCTDDGLIDDDDEDDKQPVHLVVWKDGSRRKHLHDLKNQIFQECVVELFYARNHRIRRLQPRLRQTRRLWRQSELLKSR